MTSHDPTFARRIFRAAAIYGFIVVPLMLLPPWPGERPELLLGFVGLALVFQAMFWLIGGDPARYRAMMPFGIAEKLAFGGSALLLSLAGRTGAAVGGFAAVDLALAAAFWLAMRRTPMQSTA